MIITPKEIYQKLKHASEFRVELKCDSCGKISSTSYANYYNRQKKINFSGITHCKKCSTIESSKLRIGKPSPFKGKRRPEKNGQNSPSWRGGTYISSDGYRMVYCQSKDLDNNIGWKSYKKEHKVIYEKFLGRELTKDEVIHHIDGDKLNNNLDNLVLINSDKNHRHIHHQLEILSMELVKKGLIFFDRKTNKYMANVKLRELLEQPEMANQQPSIDSNIFEGSTTRSESLMDNNSSTSAGHHIGDDIV